MTMETLYIFCQVCHREDAKKAGKRSLPVHSMPQTEDFDTKCRPLASLRAGAKCGSHIVGATAESPVTIPPSRLAPCHLPLHKGGFGVTQCRDRRITESIENSLPLSWGGCYHIQKKKHQRQRHGETAANQQKSIPPQGICPFPDHKISIAFPRGQRFPRDQSADSQR